MVGYYPQLEEGELLYSATARLAAALFPGRQASYCAARLLGNAGYSFGVLLPNNVSKLIENIPTVTGLTEDAVLRASLFHLISPLLDAAERAELRKSVFMVRSTLGRRTFNARGASTVLKYCVQCARMDADLGKPAIWRTVHNHNGAVACAACGHLLQFSNAPVRSNALCAPADWIDLAATPQAATAAEVAIARDLNAIHAQYSSLTPGFQFIVARLREKLLCNSDFASGPSLINNGNLLQAVRKSVSPSSQAIFEPQFRRLAEGHGLSMETRTTLHAYCLYAYLAGTSLKDVLLESAVPPASPKPVASYRSVDSVSFYKERIKKFMRENPHCTRSQIRTALEHSITMVRSVDPGWGERHLPQSLSNASGPHGDPNWNKRDEKLCELISNVVAKDGPVHFRSYRDALIKLGQPTGLLQKANGRLPRAGALLASLIEPKQAAA